MNLHPPKILDKVLYSKINCQILLYIYIYTYKEAIGSGLDSIMPKLKETLSFN